MPCFDASSVYVYLVARYLCYFVTCTLPRNDSETRSWWMSDGKSSMSFFVVYRDRFGGDVRLGKVACERMQVPRFCVCVCVWLFYNVSPCLDVGVSCRGEEDRGEEIKFTEVCQRMVAPPLVSAGWRQGGCGQPVRVLHDDVAVPAALVGRLGGPAHLVCPRPAVGRAQG